MSPMIFAWSPLMVLVRITPARGRAALDYDHVRLEADARNLAVIDAVARVATGRYTHGNGRCA